MIKPGNYTELQKHTYIIKIVTCFNVFHSTNWISWLSYRDKWINLFALFLGLLLIHTFQIICWNYTRVISLFVASASNINEGAAEVHDTLDLSGQENLKSNRARYSYEF